MPEFEIEQIRELIEGSYRIIYYIKPQEIDVLAIIHGQVCTISLINIVSHIGDRTD